jgi:folate-binding protein YgfZ
MPIALPYLSAARVSGPDAGAFLQAQLSADIGALQDEESTFACFCSPKGQVFGLLLVIRTGDQYRIVGAASLLPGMIARLRLFVLRAKVEIELASELNVLGISEPDAAPAAGGHSPPGTDLTYALAGDGEADADGAERWTEKELRAGIAWLGPETSERFIPQMLGFDALGAISFSKGCYPGQEIIARARYLGRVKRKPQFLLVDSEPVAAGSAVRLLAGEERLDGIAVDSVAVPGSGSLLMVVAPEPTGTIDELEHDGRTYRCATI